MPRSGISGSYDDTIFSSFVSFWLCRVFSAVSGLSLVALHGLLIAVASLVVEHQL